MEIIRPDCPYCEGKDVRIMLVEAPRYEEIIVLFACWECKGKFKGIIKMVNDVNIYVL